MARTYDSLEDVDPLRRRAVESVLREEERFETGILSRVSIATQRVYRTLVLTDRRVIAFRRGWIGEESVEYPLESISSVSYTAGRFSGRLTIRGAEFEDTYRTFRDNGRTFAAAVRNELRDREH